MSLVKAHSLFSYHLQSIKSVYLSPPQCQHPYYDFFLCSLSLKPFIWKCRCVCKNAAAAIPPLQCSHYSPHSPLLISPPPLCQSALAPPPFTGVNHSFCRGISLHLLFCLQSSGSALTVLLPCFQFFCLCGFPASFPDVPHISQWHGRHLQCKNNFHYQCFSLFYQ